MNQQEYETKTILVVGETENLQTVKNFSTKLQHHFTNRGLPYIVIHNLCTLVGQKVDSKLLSANYDFNKLLLRSIRQYDWIIIIGPLSIYGPWFYSAAFESCIPLNTINLNDDDHLSLILDFHSCESYFDMIFCVLNKI